MADTLKGDGAMEKLINSDLSSLLSIDNARNKIVFKPLVYDMSKEDDVADLEVLINTNNKQLNVHNSIESQVLELYKINHPKQKFTQKQLEDYWTAWKRENDIVYFGVWVYYPWNNNLVHLLAEKDFVKLRTSRNQYKIHPEEQELLSQKTIGLIGLSVGQSVALTLSMERVYGTLRIADFDYLELSNLNRIRASVSSLGLPKTCLVAREISEIDPFLKVEVFSEGITDENLDQFIGAGDTKLDLLIEECDSLDIKIKSRLKARAAGIPVIMDTSDRGMMDIERFDLEPSRALMHGMVDESRADKLDQWTAKERLALVMDMVGAENISSRLKSSLLEVEESITTWPQLASSVVLGGALSTVVSRQILLGLPVDSGRYYTDAEQLHLSDQAPNLESIIEKKPEELSFEACSEMLRQANIKASKDSLRLEAEELEQLVANACLAPTGGNTQPWKWIWQDQCLALFHDQHFSYSFLDYRHRGSYIGLGAAMENLEQAAIAMGIEAKREYALSDFGEKLVAVYSFRKTSILSPGPLQQFGDKLHIRMTNRYRPEKYQGLDPSLKVALEKAIAKSPMNLIWLEDREKMNKLAQIVGAVERQRILDPWGQYDFIGEARWTKEHAEESRNGVDLRTLDLSEADKVGFKLIQDGQAIANLRNWDMGQALVKMSTDSLSDAAAFMLLYCEDHDAKTMLEAGQWVEKLWLYFNANGLAYQPISPATFMFARLGQEDSSTSDYLRAELNTLRSEYLNILGLDSQVNDLFLCRLFYAREPEVKSLRKPLEAVYKNNMINRA